MDTREQFGREAEKYLTSKTHANADELARLVEIVKPSGGAVLDIATGAGHVAFAFAPFVEKIIASDITPEMLAIVDREAATRGLLNIETAHAWAEELPFDADSFDGIACRVAAHHFRDPLVFVNEVFRVLKPRGWFLLVDTIGIEADTDSDNLLNEFETIRDPSHVRDYTISQWHTWLKSTGFLVELTERNSFYHEIENWMDRMSVAEPSRTRLREIVNASTGALRDYFEPYETSFKLHQVTLFAQKPRALAEAP